MGNEQLLLINEEGAAWFCTVAEELRRARVVPDPIIGRLALVLLRANTAARWLDDAEEHATPKRACDNRVSRSGDGDSRRLRSHEGRPTGTSHEGKSNAQSLKHLSRSGRKWTTLCRAITALHGPPRPSRYVVAQQTALR